MAIFKKTACLARNKKLLMVCIAKVPTTMYLCIETVECRDETTRTLRQIYITPKVYTTKM